MSAIETLIATAKAQGVQFSVSDNKLRLSAPKGVLTPELTAQLSRHKTQIIEWLQNQANAVLNEQRFPLSYGQQALWFLYQEAPDSPAYNMAFALDWHVRVDLGVLQATLETLATRHAQCRARFETDSDGQTWQHMAAPLPVLEVIDAHAWDQPTLQTHSYHYTQQPFDLRQTGVRAGFFRQAVGQGRLIFVMHHILLDAHSILQIRQEWLALYQAAILGTDLSLPPVTRSYAHYVHAEQQLSGSAQWQRMADYWRQQLAGEIPLLNLPADRLRPPRQTFSGATYAFQLSENLTQPIKQLVKATRTTLFTFLVTAFQILLHRYTGQKDIWLGAPANGGRLLDHNFIHVVGYFVNPIVLRGQLENQTFQQLLTENHQKTIDALGNQGYPFPLLVQQLRPHRDSGISPLFQAMLSLQDQDEIGKWESEFNCTPVTIPQAEGQFDLALDVLEGTTLDCAFKYNTDLFVSERIQRLTGHFQQLLDGICAQPDQPVWQYALLTPAEVQQLRAWNTTADYPQDQTIVSLFEAQVARTPDNTAVVFEEQSLTYAELNARANQLAHVLIRHGVVADTLVGICVERSLEMIIGLLAILKAGGAYVPLDPAYPAERLAFMVQDSQVTLLLTQTHLQGSLPITDINPPPLLVCVDDPNLLAGQPVDNPLPRSQPQDLAYVIYTSGSTGKPKGVLTAQHAIANHCLSMQAHYQLTPADRVLQFASFNFDASVEQLFSTWLGGATLLVLADNRLTPAQLVQYLDTLQVTVADLPPAYWQQVCQFTDASHTQWRQTLRLLIVGGEALPLALAQDTRRYFPTLACMNAYGPTEASVTSTVYTLPEQSDLDMLQTVPIGQPIAGKTIHILDPHLQPLPPGIPGELCIAGAGLARGYLNRLELTAEKFVEVELFGQVERIYRTGDLARWWPDGHLEYLGRIDHQVKLRGFRIELGEIEAVLSLHPTVAAAAVVLQEREGNQSLAAYVVAAGRAEGGTVAAGEVTSTGLDTTALRTWLSGQLPDYMVPASFTVLVRLPLTPNGKVDRKALPEPDAITSHSHAPTPPRDTLELQLLGSWEFALNRRPLGIQDDFFALGGHSLLAVRLMGHIQQQLGLKLPLGLLFQHPSVARLADYLRQQGETVTWDNCVTIQAAGEQPPVFLLPGTFGSVLYLQPLAALLGTAQPVYALQTPGLGGEAATPETVEALAAYHLQAVRQRQPHGPYRLVGHSSGGRVAFAMAQQLEQQGEQLSLLGVLDTMAPGGPRPPDLGEADEPWLWSLAMLMESLTGLTLGITLEGLQALADREAAYRYTLQAFQRQQVMFSAHSTVDDLRQWVTVTRISSNAHGKDQATPTRLHCPIHLFRASDTTQVAGEEAVWEDTRPYWGWDAHTLAGVIEIPVPGTHVSMMTMPNVPTLAAVIGAKSYG